MLTASFLIRIIATGYVNSPQPGFLFVADDAAPGVWELDTSGRMVREKLLSRDMLPQGAKIRQVLLCLILVVTDYVAFTESFSKRAI